MDEIGRRETSTTSIVWSWVGVVLRFDSSDPDSSLFPTTFVVLISGKCKGTIYVGPSCGDEAVGTLPVTADFNDKKAPIGDTSLLDWYENADQCIPEPGTTGNFVMYKVEGGDYIYIDLPPGGGALPDFELSIIPYEDEETTCGDLGCPDGTIVVPSAVLCDADSICCQRIANPNEPTSLLAIRSTANSFDYRIHSGEAPCFDKDFGYLYDDKTKVENCLCNSCECCTGERCEGGEGCFPEGCNPDAACGCDINWKTHPYSRWLGYQEGCGGECGEPEGCGTYGEYAPPQGGGSLDMFFVCKDCGGGEIYIEMGEGYKGNLEVELFSFPKNEDIAEATCSAFTPIDTFGCEGEGGFWWSWTALCRETENILIHVAVDSDSDPGSLFIEYIDEESSCCEGQN